MKPTDDIKKFIENAAVHTQADKDNEILSQMLTAFQQNQSQTADIRPSVWRHIMNSQITKLAAAAAIVIVVGLVAYQNNIPIGVTPVYGIEQTIEACHGTHYLHTKSFYLDHESPIEGWMEFDDAGDVLNVRLHMPQWTGPDDGDKVIVWNNHKANVWIKKKNLFAVIKDNTIAEMITRNIQSLDPKTAMCDLQQLEIDGQLYLDIDQPDDKAEAIVITATLSESFAKTFSKDKSVEYGLAQLVRLLGGLDKDISEIVLFIDQATRLVKMIEFYTQDGDQKTCLFVQEYQDYNQLIDPEMFQLEKEIPDDAIRINQAAREIGLEQGQLSDNEVAVELIRQFLQALIDRDYAEAGRLFSGVPAERMEKTYENVRFIRIISIGDPVPHAMTGGLFVPCTVEIEEDGKIIQWRPEHSYVRQVHGQPERWEIIGGFRGI